MVLKELISALEALPQERLLPHGFGNPHSYRGYYYDLAFEPKDNAVVREMLADARNALGSTYDGYKGGEFTMGERTDCWLANYGDTGESLSAEMLRGMVAEADLRDARAELAECEKDYAEAVKVVHSMFHNPGVPNAAAIVVLSTDRARRVLGGDILPGYTVEDPVEQP